MKSVFNENRKSVPNENHNSNENSFYKNLVADLDENCNSRFAVSFGVVVLR